MARADTAVTTTARAGSGAGGRATRVLIVHEHFWPEPSSYAYMLRLIAARLAADGYEVRVLTMKPTYRPSAVTAPVLPAERLDGFTVRRVQPLLASLGGTVARRHLRRFGNTMRFLLTLAREALSGRPDVIMVTTAPPILEPLAVTLLARIVGARVLLHVQDIHPELMRLAGLPLPQPLFALLRAIDGAVARAADAVVTLSETMRATLAGRGVDPGRVALINSFDFNLPAEAPTPLPGSFIASRGSFRIVFAGNMGPLQNLDALVLAMSLLDREERIRLFFVGDGAAKARLQRMAGPLRERSIRFVEPVPAPTVAAMLEEADLGIVSLGPGTTAYAWPSKVISYLCAGLPILAIMETESELAGLLVRHGAGIAAEPDPQLVASAIRDAARQVWAADEPARERRRGHVRAVATRLFGREAALDAWSQTVAGLLAADAPALAAGETALCRPRP
jgi:colanic acid biosynthesis glycosyl transferase WcaI